MTYRIPNAVHAELLNWSRWCWTGPWPHPMPPSQCGSIEAGYRAPPAWNPQDPPEPPTIRPNERNARVVQAVWDALAGAPRLVLKAEYPGRGTSGRTDGRHAAAVALGLTVAAYETALALAVNRVEAAFAVRV
ncbi:MAG: hypothetical protein JWQ72_2981 [Polaromonas sp.]|nr:hypothetical protein [Polaromonas sp.]